MSILSVNASTSNTVTVKRGNNTINSTKSNKQISCKPCKIKEEFAPEQMSCEGNSPCIRTGFARPQSRLAVPYKRFAQPNKRLARPKVRCNSEKRARNYYSGGMPKSGMTKRYGTDSKNSRTMPKIGMTKRYNTNSSRKRTPEISRFSKDFSTKKAYKPTTCKGITYYGSNNICK